MPNVTREELERLVRRYLVASGCLDEVAVPVAHALVRAEAEGNTVCGLFYLPVFKEQLAMNKVDGRARPKVVRNEGSSILVDAAHGFAHPAIDLATKVLVKAARKNGVAAAGITHSYNALSLAHHVLPLAKTGLLGLCCSNAPACVAPPGGTKPTFGTNPMAFAVPGTDGPTLVVDQSASTVTQTQLLLHKERHQAILPGWAQDDKGQVTTDPAIGLAGSLLPFGGQKGANVGLIVEVLSAVLTGASLSFQAASFSGQDPGYPDVGQFLLAIDPKRFSAETFESALNALELKFEESSLRLPGKRFRDNETTAEKHEIAVDRTLWNELSAQAS